MSAKALSELENEGRRLQDMAEKAPAEEQIEYLTRAMELFTPHSAVYPIWREPWGSIRHDMKVANITQGKWFSALGHALKIYFYIDPVLFPDKWSPQRAMRTYVLLRVITEIAYQISGPQSNEQLHRELSKYEINFLVVAKNLSNEVEMAISKGYGSDHPFAADFQRFKAAEIPTGQFGGRAEWENERAKLKRAADEMNAEEAAELKKKRTFRKFSYRGVDLDQLLDLSSSQLRDIVHARARRRFNRGLKRKPMGLIKKLRRAKQNAKPNEKPDLVKTHLRDMIVVPEMIGSVIGIYSGKEYNQVEIKPEMVGFYLGEFSISYKPVKHGRPGIGATHSSRFIPLK
ncbi:MAG: hypothetical protein LQ338_000914 [Usnochroma carphineum]|nr:MAG: hypothetical protein LQ338_000914 [Usnochroma carphineum]